MKQIRERGFLPIQSAGGCPCCPVRWSTFVRNEASVARAMHELSTEKAAEARAERVSAVHVRLGMLCGVVREALRKSSSSRKPTPPSGPPARPVAPPPGAQPGARAGNHGAPNSPADDEPRTASLLLSLFPLSGSCLPGSSSSPPASSKSPASPKSNDARALRGRFNNAAGLFVVSLVSSPGAGKTTLTPG